MYRINVLSNGEYHNVALGYRYCFRKKTAMRLIDTFLKSKCDIAIYKLVKIHSDVFCWGYLDDDDKVYKYYCEKMEENS